MTKAELIELIKECPDRAEIVVDAEGCVFPLHVDSVKVYLEDETIAIIAG